MVEKGAKNIIMPSRSGPSSQPALAVVSSLANQDVYVITSRCNVASATELSTLVRDCAAKMPPIKGCINAAMVLQVCYGSLYISQANTYTYTGFYIREYNAYPMVPNNPVQSQRKLKSPPTTTWRYGFLYSALLSYGDLRQSWTKQLRRRLHFSRCPSALPG